MDGSTMRVSIERHCLVGWLVDRYPIRDFQLHVRRTMGPQMSLNPIIDFHSIRDYFIQVESRQNQLKIEF